MTCKVNVPFDPVTPLPSFHGLKTAPSAKDVSDWCAAKRLQLNADETELLWFGTVPQLHQLASECRTISINETMIEPTNAVRIDANLTMRSHVSRVTVLPRRAFSTCASVVSSAKMSQPD